MPDHEFCEDGCVLLGKHDECVSEAQYFERRQADYDLLLGFFAGGDELPTEYRQSQACFDLHSTIVNIIDGRAPWPQGLSPRR